MVTMKPSVFALVFCVCLVNCVSGQDYGLALSLSQKFYEANRAGDLPDDNRVSWRKDSFLGDGQDVGRDLTGGYFDGGNDYLIRPEESLIGDDNLLLNTTFEKFVAGDFVKFGFPMAYSVSVLAMGMVDFADGYQRAGEADFGRRTLKWGTDYFMKAHTAPNELYGQVGNGGEDHSYWGRPEDYGNSGKSRPSYKIDANNPDLAAETAAALAASSLVFRGHDDGYANELVRHARELYDFANQFRRVYHESITDAAGYYQSWSGYNDELVWAAAWLHRATGEQYYLSEAENKYNEFNFDGQYSQEFSWDDKKAGVYVSGTEYQIFVGKNNPIDVYLLQAILYRITNNQRYANKLTEFCDRVASGDKTPGGLFWIQDLGLGGGYYRSLAKGQIDYLLGSNPTGLSYQIGYSGYHPLRPHHRSRSWSGYNDELVWAAAWLHRATGEQYYLSEAENKYNEFNFDGQYSQEFSWDDKKAGVYVSGTEYQIFVGKNNPIDVYLLQAILYRITNNQRYANKLTEFCDRVASGDKTPGGLFWIQDLGLGGGYYRSLAKGQIDYLLGSNPTGLSYQIGYSGYHPLRPHHRSSSCPTVEQCGGCVCDWSHYDSPAANPQVLEGALVGGPDHNDQYNDDRHDYVHAEVATDYNAAFQGSLAALVIS
ncbi:unnamed protein product [Notodromas monacha]|uniref:Endoglucanase n=1 Tax=Notodromas monacha TaxID=399045 RepID=A0A7R9BGW2_9CRUS|nr:unnamed protein product [Notodromas monacha]CAG0915238.1 unnamed protein product [Notodromas monacha]